MLPSRAFRCRNPGILKSAGIYTGNRQETFQKLKPPSGIIITLGIMTVTWVTSGDQHAIGSPLKRLEQGTLIIRRSVACWNRATPAVSAPP
jgi:hypothetical protein